MQVINATDPLVIEKTIEVLKKGGLVVYPTETCYGIGADATKAEAVTKVLDFKKRMEGKAIAIAAADKQMAELYVELNKTASELYKQFLPGPVTIISKSLGITDKRLESEKQTLGIRIPDYELVLNIIDTFGKPITTTAANQTGTKIPYSINDVLENTSSKQKELIDLIIDAGDLPKNPPSTVIDTTSEELKTLREGVIDVKEIKRELITNSEEETTKMGFDLMEELFPKAQKEPILILLEGDLGSGKTHLTKGVAEFLKIDRPIKSPTYTYVEEYEYDLSNAEDPAFERSSKSGMFYHIDAWRIENMEDLKALEIENLMIPKNIIVIEWPSVINELDEKYFKDFKMTKVFIENTGENSRKIIIH